ncbi:MAG: cupin domain-containing protein [Alphaproteobacteria bacterium]
MVAATAPAREAVMPDLKLPALDPASVPEKGGTGYPPPYRALVAGRYRRRLGDAAGIRNFGVNLTRLEPGSASAHRHWHEREDEFVYVLEGELVLITNAGAQVLKAGMAAGFPGGVPDGHHLVNRSDKPALFLEIGDRPAGDRFHYPDIDLEGYDESRAATVFTHKDGRPW